LGAGDVRGACQAPAAHEAERRHGRHELRPVHQREALLRRQPHRLQADHRERLRTRKELPVHRGLAFADEWQRQMGQRCEVAAGADGAARGHVRHDIAAEALQEEPNRLGASAGIPLRQRVRA
jgi:hypothetical protein